jgi:hypothetical protein
MRTIERDPIVIISLGLPFDDYGKEQTTNLLWMITGQERTAVKGAYKGEAESSVILPAAVWREHEPALRELLNTYSQQCIFYADGQRNAWLCNAPAFDIDQGAERKFIGELVSRPLKGWTTALPESYTQVGENIHYVR